MNQSHFLLQVVKALVTTIGILIAILGGLFGILFIVGVLLSPEALTLDSAASSAAVVILGVGLGGALAWQGGNALLNRPSTIFHLPPIWVLLIIFVSVVALGQSVISFDLLPTLTFPPFHIVAAAIPPFAILAFASRAFKEAGFRWRELIVQLSGGAFLTTTIAIIAEITIGLILFFLAALMIALTPEGAAFIEELGTNLQNPTWLEDPNNIQELLLFPPVSITLAIVFIILAPLLEEFLKLLGVVLMSYRRPSQAQAFLWGLASGAGFALMENFFNTVLALQIWGIVILLRLGATAMHCLGSGLTALGWHAFLAEHRPWKLLGAYGLSVTIHALWNAVIVGIVGISIFVTDPASETTLAVVGGIVSCLLILLIGLASAIIIALVVITNRLRTGLAVTPVAT